MLDNLADTLEGSSCAVLPEGFQFLEAPLGILRKKHQFGHQHRAGRMAAGFHVRKITLRKAKEMLNALLLHGGSPIYSPSRREWDTIGAA